MNAYQIKMAQVLKTQAAINTMLHEVWLLKELGETAFGDNQFNGDHLENIFQNGMELSELMATDILVAHNG